MNATDHKLIAAMLAAMLEQAANRAREELNDRQSFTSHEEAAMKLLTWLSEGAKDAYRHIYSEDPS